MSPRQRGLRAELANVLGVDQYTLQVTVPDLPPPRESLSIHFSNLISHAIAYPDEARTLYSYLPAIMLRMFGYASGKGWLETCSEHTSRDRDALVSIVLPDGPLHTFCKRSCRERSENTKFAADMKFEFPKRNLPPAAEYGLRSPGNITVQTSKSYLAPLFASSMRDCKDDIVLLSPLEYFYMCMVASPANKWVNQSGPHLSNEKPRRSRSIPSIRAQYNQVIAAYASRYKGKDPFDADNIFLAACLDYLILPWVTVQPLAVPPLSTATADTVASLLLALVPSRPEDLDLESDISLEDQHLFLDSRTLTNTSSLYRLVGPMLKGFFDHFDSSPTASQLTSITLCAYIRILALFIAPWRTSVRASLKSLLFPKARSSSSSAARSSSMAAISSTLSSINAHLPSPSGSPGNSSAAKESLWRTQLHNRQALVDKDLVRQAVVHAAHSKLGSFSDGAKSLTLLGEALQGARLFSAGGPETDEGRIQEMHMCLNALREQRSHGQTMFGLRDKNFVSMLSLGFRLKADSNGVLGGLSEMAGDSVAGMVQMVSGATNGNGAIVKRRARSFRSSATAISIRKDTPLIGNVWDLPIAAGENETMVLAAYWVALRLEPALGFIPNCRVLGRYWIWMAFMFCALTGMTVKSLIATLRM